nr:NSP1 protein [Rotavirus A]
MATFKNACYFYKKMCKNNQLTLGANKQWTPSPPEKFKGWCLDCCRYTSLTHCNGCSLYHVCQLCSQESRCFLDNSPHLLRMRTFIDPIKFEDLDNYVKSMSKIFPVNAKVVDKSLKTVRQNKCRNEISDLWHDHLTLPVSLQCLRISIDGVNYYIMGFYQQMNALNETPFSFYNLIDKYDRLLLDDYNFKRMEHLPYNLQSIYAQKYWCVSRFISHPQKSIKFDHFTTATLENQQIPTSPIYVRRNEVQGSRSWKIQEWNQLIKLSDNVREWNRLVNDSDYIVFSVSQKNKLFILHKFEKLMGIVVPNYIASNHVKRAVSVKKCKWCTIANLLPFCDYRFKNIYNVIMDFLRALCKSNLSIGHCSSVEGVYEIVPYLFNPYGAEFTSKLHIFFSYLEPVEIKGTEYVIFSYPLHPDSQYVIFGNEIPPTILSESQIMNIIINIIDYWFNFNSAPSMPLTLRTTNALHYLRSIDKLEDEYALLIS